MDVIFLSGDGGHHFGVAVATETISQHHGHHTVSKANVVSLVALRLLIQLHDAHLKGEERTIDVLGLADGLLVVVSRLVDALRACQIHQMQLGNCTNIRAHLLTVNLDHEDAVGARRRVVHGRLGDDTVRIADEKQVQRIFFILRAMH